MAIVLGLLSFVAVVMMAEQQRAGDDIQAIVNEDLSTTGLGDDVEYALQMWTQSEFAKLKKRPGPYLSIVQ